MRLSEKLSHKASNYPRRLTLSEKLRYKRKIKLIDVLNQVSISDFWNNTSQSADRVLKRKFESLSFKLLF